MLSRQPQTIPDYQIPLIVRDLQLGDLAAQQRDIYKEQNANLKNIIVQQVDTIQALKVDNINLGKSAVKFNKKAKRRGKLNLFLILLDLAAISAIRFL